MAVTTDLARVVVSVSGGELAGPILGRVVALLAARASFSIDRIADAQVVTDTISAQAPAYMADRLVRVEIEGGERWLRLHVGPLAAAGGRRLLAASRLATIGSPLERLSDELAVHDADANADGSEHLELALRESG